MADEKGLALASSTYEWVKTYYGDDGYDHAKAKKLIHIQNICQFEAVAFVINKNSKKAHVDFSDVNYSTLQNRYVQAAELIIKLLYIRFNEDRKLTRADFDACGGDKIFSGDLDKICEDYIGPGGMVDMCQTAFPVSSSNEKTAEEIKKVTDDMDLIKGDHKRLLAITGSKDGILKQKDIGDLFLAATESASGLYKKYKGERSDADKELEKLAKKALYIDYDLAKKSTKLAVVAGTSIASIGAVISGVFWPAILLIPAYTLAKSWGPDFCKSVGAKWGLIEGKYKAQRSKDIASATLKWMASYAETGGKPQLSAKEWFALGGVWGVIRKNKSLRVKNSLLLAKKGAKVLETGVEFEGTDEKIHESRNQKIQNAVLSTIGDLANADSKDLYHADAQDYFDMAIKHINAAGSAATFNDIKNLAQTFKDYASKLPIDKAQETRAKFAKATADACQRLIFNTEMNDLSYIANVVLPNLKDGSTIMEVLQGGDDSDVAKIRNLRTFASKELSGLDKSFQGRTLEEYINVTINKISRVDLNAKLAGAGSEIIDMIENISLNNSLNPEYSTAYSAPGPGGTTVMVSANISEVLKRIGAITDPVLRDKCDKLLKDQMNRVYLQEMRKESQATYEEIQNSAHAGKVGFDELFKNFDTITYDNLGGISNILETISKSKPDHVAKYAATKFRKTVYDKILEKINNETTGSTPPDLAKLTSMLTVINGSGRYLDERQKMDLSSKLTPFIKAALQREIASISDNFMDNYKGNFFTTLISQDYSKGGLREYFENDKSTEVLEVQGMVEYMKDLSSVHRALKFDGAFNMDRETDVLAIGKGLIMPTDFKTITARGKDDALIRFISTNIEGISVKYTPINTTKTDLNEIIGDIKPRVTAVGSTYDQLKSALGEIDQVPEGVDRQTAIIALKNKCVAMFKGYMASAINSLKGNGEDAQHYLDVGGGGNIANAIISIWRDGIMSEIDQKMVSLGVANIKSATSETNTYTTPRKIIESYERSH